MNHVVMMSSGAGSWAAAKRVVEKYSAEDVTLVFTDVKGNNPSEHAGEDKDNYRFLRQASFNVGAPLVWLSEGRDIWQVFEDEHMLGNSRIPICSKRLKQEPSRAFMDGNYDLDDTIIYLGLDWTEQHRLDRNAAGWAPWKVEYPMMWEPWIDKGQVFEWLREEGIRPPRLYDLGYSHANCGGFCCQMGQADAERLLRTNPERYAYHEGKEQEFRERHGKDVAFMVDRVVVNIAAKRGLTMAEVAKRAVATKTGKPKTEWYVVATGEALPGRIPLTMQEFRERLQLDATLFDADDQGPCACFPFAEEVA